MVENNGLAVEVLRNRFSELLSGMGDGVPKKLGIIDAYYDSVTGYHAFQNAKRGRAGEAAMRKLVATMEAFLALEGERPKSVNRRAARRPVVDAVQRGKGADYVPWSKAGKELEKRINESKR